MRRKPAEAQTFVTEHGSYTSRWILLQANVKRTTHPHYQQSCKMLSLPLHIKLICNDSDSSALSVPNDRRDPSQSFNRRWKESREDWWCHCGLSRCYKVTFMTPSTPIKTQSQYDQSKLFRWLTLTNVSSGVRSCYSNNACQFVSFFWLFFCQLSHQQGSFRLMLLNVCVHVNYYLPSPLSHIATQIFCTLNNLWVQTIFSKTGQLSRAEAGPLGASRCRRREPSKIKMPL